MRLLFVMCVPLPILFELAVNVAVDSIYLFSDGFADQFGGDKGKKYKYSPFQEKLKAINHLSLQEQNDQMQAEFLKWKGTHDQVDDVLLIGIRI